VYTVNYGGLLQNSTTMRIWLNFKLNVSNVFLYLLAVFIAFLYCCLLLYRVPSTQTQHRRSRDP